MRETESLWNITNKKLQRVREYINDIQPKEIWGAKATQYFETIKAEAMKTNNADTALTIIGYQYQKKPKFINEANKQDEKNW